MIPEDPTASAAAEPLAAGEPPAPQESPARPYPLFQPLPAAGELMPTPEHLAEWTALPATAALLRLGADPALMLQTAERFLQRFADAPAEPHACLLHAEDSVTYWLAGDVHGNAAGLAALYSFAEAQARRAGGTHRLVLLGDILDRGEQDLEAAAMVQHLLLQEQPPVPLLLVRGNHDMGLARKEDGTFYSTVSPAETADRLNAMADRSAAQTLGRASMLMARLAYTVGELAGVDAADPQKALLFTHGGLPHVDLQEKIRAAAAAEQPQPAADALTALPPALREQAAKDYTWVRLVDKLPHKIPNRSASGCQMGTEDVNAYRRLHRELTGRSITFIVRGHDHEDAGYRLYSAQAGLQEHKRLQQQCGVLTLNAMAADDLAPDRRVCVVRCRRGEPLTLFRMGVGDTAAAEPPAASAASEPPVVPPPVPAAAGTGGAGQGVPLRTAAPLHWLKHWWGGNNSAEQ